MCRFDDKFLKINEPIFDNEFSAIIYSGRESKRFFVSQAYEYFFLPFFDVFSLYTCGDVAQYKQES